MKEAGEFWQKTKGDIGEVARGPSALLGLRLGEYIGQGKPIFQGIREDTRRSIGGVLSLAFKTPFRLAGALLKGSARMLWEGVKMLPIPLLPKLEENALDTREKVGSVVPEIFTEKSARLPPVAETMRKPA